MKTSDRTRRRGWPHHLALTIAMLVASLPALADESALYEPLTANTETSYVFHNLVNSELVNPGAEKFEFLSETEEINGVTTRVMKTVGGPDDGVLTFYTNDAQGYREHGIRTPGGTVREPLTITYSEPLLILPATFDETFKQTTFAEAQDIGRGELQFTVQHQSKILGYEVIETGFGNYEAVKIQRYIRTTHATQPDDYKERFVWMWMSKGLGIVRSWICDNRINCIRRFNNYENVDQVQALSETDRTYVPEPGPAAQLIPAASLLVWLRSRGRRASRG